MPLTLTPLLLKLNDFEILFKKMANTLNLRYKALGVNPEHLVAHIYFLHPELCRRTEKAQGEVDRVWRLGLEGKATLIEFKKVLRVWFWLEEAQIKIFKKEVCKPKTALDYIHEIKQQLAVKRGEKNVEQAKG